MKKLRYKDHFDAAGNRISATKKSSKRDNRYNVIKEKAVKYKGGSCLYCGYNKNNRALHFHHLDPEDKITEISKLITKKTEWQLLTEELDKCILVCANCHAELH